MTLEIQILNWDRHNNMALACITFKRVITVGLQPPLNVCSYNSFFLFCIFRNAVPYLVRVPREHYPIYKKNMSVKYIRCI